jgi:8-oxo-dGTP pyrophosphatase MutT (NUDIX family)
MQRVTEAGAIAVRCDHETPQILVVTAKKDPSQWIFPKGHIKPDENAEAAAIRELREEGGVEGELLEFVGVLEFTSGDEEVFAIYYLIAYSNEIETDEFRERRWCGLDEALELLTFDDAKQLLAENARPLIEKYVD